MIPVRHFFVPRVSKVVSCAHFGSSFLASTTCNVFVCCRGIPPFVSLFVGHVKLTVTYHCSCFLPPFATSLSCCITLDPIPSPPPCLTLHTSHSLLPSISPSHPAMPPFPLFGCLFCSKNYTSEPRCGQHLDDFLNDYCELPTTRRLLNHPVAAIQAVRITAHRRPGKKHKPVLWDALIVPPAQGQLWEFVWLRESR